MKYLVAILLFFISLSAAAQVVFRNDFSLGKNKKAKNRGISFIAINLDRGAPNPNMLVYGRGGKTLLIDMQALRGRKKYYTYSELAARIYTPGPVYRPNEEPVPMFLLIEPSHVRRHGFPIERLQVREITAPRLQSFRLQ